LEADLGKRRILELYLNVIEWGDGIYGCQAAAQTYFGTPASALGPEEAAGLAAMIPNPRRINPQVSPAAYARARKRVLWLMAHAGFLANAGLGREPPPPPEPEEGEAAEPDQPLR
jgi:monofunctional biosynthetic peptidoglycan transglycosylase